MQNQGKLPRYSHIHFITDNSAGRRIAQTPISPIALSTAQTNSNSGYLHNSSIQSICAPNHWEIKSLRSTKSLEAHKNPNIHKTFKGLKHLLVFNLQCGPVHISLSVKIRLSVYLQPLSIPFPDRKSVV